MVELTRRSLELGRGCEKLLASGRADEIVRMYDGRDNPLGRSYTLAELRQLVEGLFQIEEVGYFFFPARALPVSIPRWLHRWLHHRFGLMIILFGRRLDPAGGTPRP